MDAGNQLQDRHVLAVDVLGLEEEGEDEQGQQDEVEETTDEAADAHGAVIQEVTADDDGHGHGRHDVQAGVVQGGEPPVRQRGIDVIDGPGIQGREVHIGRKDGIAGGQHHEDDDERGDGTDDAGNAVHVHKAHQEHEDQHDGAADPHGDAGELLVDIGATTGEHDEADGKQRNKRGPVQDLGGDW